VPLTFKGWLAIKIGLHLGVRNLIPTSVISVLLKLRARFYRSKSTPKQRED